jgi:hypothetical protein
VRQEAPDFMRRKAASAVARHGGVERRIVLQAQVETKPDDHG